VSTHVHPVWVDSQSLGDSVENKLDVLLIHPFGWGECDEVILLRYRFSWGQKRCPNPLCTDALLERELEILFSLVRQADQKPGVPDVGRMLFPVAEDVQGGFDGSPPIDFILGLDVKPGILFVDADFGTVRLLDLG
jgi:hypothetical protein